MQELLSLYLLAFVSGILTTFQPCIFPLMPTYLSYMTNGKKSSKLGIISSIFLTIGILIIFLTLALLIKSGQVWIAIFLNTYTVEFNIFIASLLIIFGMIMILKIDIELFYKLPTIIQTKLSAKSDNYVISSFYLGLSYTAIAAPCAAPIFLSLITLIIFFQPAIITTIILIYAIGAGTPFLIIGATIPYMKFNLNKQFNQIAKWIKPISGFILILMGVYLLNAYYFPYYPFRMNDFIFRGIGEYILFEIYFLILGIPFMILIIYIMQLYVKRIILEKKQVKIRNIE